MCTQGLTPCSPQWPGPEQMADVRWAASQMTGATRRAFEAAMTRQDCGGHARQAARVFGGGRHTVAWGLAERRTGGRCLDAQSACRGRQRWEDVPPPVAEALRQQAEAQAHHAPTCRQPLASTRRPASGALEVLRAPGARNDPPPAPSTRAAGLNRRGGRLRPEVKAQPHKQRKATAAIFATITKRLPTPRPREASIACASMGKRPGTLGSVRAAVSPGAVPSLRSRPRWPGAGGPVWHRGGRARGVVPALGSVLQNQ
jgi:hypothetical protein